MEITLRAVLKQIILKVKENTIGSLDNIILAYFLRGKDKVRAFLLLQEFFNSKVITKMIGQVDRGRFITLMAMNMLVYFSKDRETV